jgi:hypothetical protein
MNSKEICYSFPEIYSKVPAIVKPVGVLVLVCPYVVVIRYTQKSFIQNTLTILENKFESIKTAENSTVRKSVIYSIRYII